MTWRHYLQVKTRTPAFLWRMVIGILACGMAGGLLSEGAFRSSAPSWGIDNPVESPADQIEKLAQNHQWRALWWALPEMILHRAEHIGPVIVAAFSGGCWLVFCLQAAQIRSRRDWQFWLLSLAIVLGAVSLWPAHFLGYWVEYRWNIRESVEFAPGLRYCILGIGVPEELGKLICFLPLMPLLLKLRSDLAALMTAACVGLGFAIAENVTYFHISFGAGVVNRFLTANPFHMALTGLAGLAVYRAARDPRGWGQHALAVVGVVIFAHGLYDAMILFAAHLGDLAFLNLIIFLLAIYQFFRELRDLRHPRRDTISLTANFLAGVSLVTAVTFIYVSGLVGFHQACDVIAMNVIGMPLMAYVFLREMPETMVTV